VLHALLAEPSDPTHAVVVLPALGVPARFYRRFAEHVAAAGMAVLVLDYRGCGTSVDRPHKQDPATLSEWAKLDAPAAIAEARRRWSVPVVAVGHSFGGQCLGLLPLDARPDAAVVVAAGSADFSLYPPALAFRYRLQLFALPLITALYGYVPGRLGLGADLPKGVVSEWARWCHTRGYARGALPAADVHYDSFDRRMLFVEVEDDVMSPTRPFAELMSWYTAAARTHVVAGPSELGVRQIGHFGVFALSSVSPVWDKIIDWIRG
jgi:predicted alpha/beta hydrolase